jgi:diaminopimelate decarboxylase/aspartate kinase
LTTPNPASAPLIVIKLGGTSVADAAAWAHAADAIRARLARGERVLVVQSALAGATDALERLSREPDPGARHAIIAELAERHATLARALHLPDDASVAAVSAGAARLGEAAAAATAPRNEDGSLAPRDRARVLAQGELAASALGVRALARALGRQVDWLDARELLRAERPAHQAPAAAYLNAVCDSAPDPALVARLALLAEKGAPCALTQGFIASNADGETVLLGRGGSDTAAAYLAARAGAAALEIWTDVAGMYTADPRLVPAARLLKQLDYAEAQEIATTGAKVLHPRCLEPVRRHAIPLTLRCSADPTAPGTRIEARVADGAALQSARVKAISVRRGVTLVSMDTVGMWQQVGFLADAFAVFKRHGISIDLVSTSETCVTASLDEPATGVSAAALDALCRDLEPICRPRLIRGCAAVSIVGRGIRAILHRLAPALELFDERAVYLVSQAASDLNLTFVLDEADAERIVGELHALLVPAGEDDAVFGARWDARAAPPRPAAPVWWRAQRAALLALAEAGTPRYVYSAAAIRAARAELAALTQVERVLYSMKANPHPGVLRVMRGLGLGFECVAPGEVARLRALFPDLAPDEVLFTPNFAPRAEYAQAFADGIPTTVDNLWALEAWPELFRGRDLFLRLDPGHGAGHHRHVRTAGLDSKFGIALADAPRAAARARALDARVVGLHLHLGSGIREAEAWREAGEALAAVADQFPEARVLDLGGGLGIPDAGAGLDLAALDAHLGALRARLPGRALWLEPGRFLVARAGVLLARVTQTKGKGARDDGRRFVGIDAGMNSLIRPALYGAHHPIVNLTRLDAPSAGTVDVVGPICETGDVLGHDRALPECQEGDVLLIADAGAYGAAMASRYNLREPADEVLLDG